MGTSRYSGTFASATHVHRFISVVVILALIPLCGLLFVVCLDLVEFGKMFVFFELNLILGGCDLTDGHWQGTVSGVTCSRDYVGLLNLSLDDGFLADGLVNLDSF